VAEGIQPHPERLQQVLAEVQDVIKRHVLGYERRSTVERLLEVDEALRRLARAYEEFLPVFSEDQRLGFIDVETNTVRWVGRVVPLGQVESEPQARREGE
jgi:hypothetical protein